MRTPRHHPFLEKVALELRRVKAHHSQEAKTARKARKRAQKDEKKKIHIRVPSAEGSLGPPKSEKGPENDQKGTE